MTASMHQSGMRTNLKGRVENLKLNGRRDVLQPLFEAVSNSLQSIVAAGQSRGHIRIELFRDDVQGNLSLEESGDRSSPCVHAVRITDNGKGFTEENYESFLTLDSRSKAEIGGKGVGRLVWLKMFDHIDVDSTFISSGALQRRTFTFSLANPDGVLPLETKEPLSSEPTTTVNLSALRPSYSKYFRHRASTIKAEIVKHFLPVFLSGKFPLIEIIDGDELQNIAALDLPPMSAGSLDVGGQAFNLWHMKVRSPQDRHHAIYYCAHKRVVKTDRVKGIPGCRFSNGEEDFYYQVYVASPYLDEHVTQERTGFSIEDNADIEDLLGELSFAQIKEKVTESANNFLAPFLSEMRATKEERIVTMLDETYPEYAYIRDYNKIDLENIPVDASVSDIEESIAQIHFKNQKTGRRLFKEVIDDIKSGTSIDADRFQNEYDKKLEDVVTINQASLVSYLLFRQGVLDLYDEILRKSNDQFQKESAVHNLIFPMGKERDGSESFIKHNLWLIDERLTYANYIASDKQIRTHKPLFGVASQGEPDIVAYFPLSFSPDDPDEILHNVVIVEFKRPGPLANRNENPYQQVIRYIRDMRSGYYEKDSGKKIKVGETTRFYAYIVCDLDGKIIQDMIEESLFTPIFGGDEGYFLYNSALRAYIEVVPLERILRDSRRNHRAFFERAGLLTRSKL